MLKLLILKLLRLMFQFTQKLCTKFGILLIISPYFFVIFNVALQTALIIQ
jgi:hypothetical protein